MRSDLNMVTNTVDVVSYDVKEIKNKVDVLDTEMAETKQVTQHLQKDVETNRIISSVALAFGVIGTVTGVSSIGMQLASSGISFATKAGTNMLTNLTKAPASTVANPEGYTIFSSLVTRSLVTDLTPLLEWCTSEYKGFPEITYEDEADNPKTSAASIYTTIDICNTFRESLKPAFKMLTNRCLELSDEVTNAAYITKDDLVRDDTVDVFASVSASTLLLEFEDAILNGLIVFKIFVKNKVADTSIVRRMYIKVSDGVIAEYKGVQDADVTIDGITIKLLARSEDDRAAYMPTAVLEEQRIAIAINAEYNVAGAVRGKHMY